MFVFLSTESAVVQILEKGGGSYINPYLRINIFPGGCSGLEYSFSWEDGDQLNLDALLFYNHMESSTTYGVLYTRSSNKESHVYAIQDDYDLGGQETQHTLTDYFIGNLDKHIIAVIDSTSLGYVTGGCLDYIDTLSQAGFVINNPQAKSTCGCGKSFS